MSSLDNNEHKSSDPSTSSTRPSLDTNGSVGGKLSTMTLTNITIISIVGFVSILLMLFGDFEGKISRVLSTLILFAIFTFCTSWHQNKHTVPIQLPMSLIGNIYMLVLSLILIWGTLGVEDYFEDGFMVFSTLVIAGLVQLGVFLTGKIAIFISVAQRQLAGAASLTAIGMALTTVLFTLPLGLDEILTFGEGYWKFAVAVILFTGLMLSIMSLMVWAFKSKSVPALQPAHDSNRPNPMAGASSSAQPQAPHAPYVAGQSAPQAFQNKPMSVPQEPVKQQGQEMPALLFSAPQAGATPWPVFPNGLPLPAKLNGRPDFSALQTVANMHTVAEKQFFGD